ncbi:ABC transporter permease [Gemmatimonadota bacterium]
MESLLQDLKYGLKLLWKEKGFTVTALLTLAVCIGANSTIFSVINTVILRPLPYDDPGRLVMTFNNYPGAGAGDLGAVAGGDYFFRRDGIEAFAECGLFDVDGSTLGDENGTEQVTSMRVTPSFLPMLGVEPAIGRHFTEEEMVPGNELKAIITHTFWQDRFSGSPDILDQELRIDGRTFTIIGVLPEDFQLWKRADTRFFLPIAFSEEARGLNSLHNNSFEMLARLAPDATIEQAVSQLAALNQILTEQSPIPNAIQLLEDAGFHTQVHDLQRFLVRDIRDSFYMLWVGVFLVLLIGCVNIANLLFTRSNTRMGELATRFALGADRKRLARQLISESVLLSVIGGVLGIGVALLGMKFLTVLGADQVPRGTEIGLDGSVLLFTFLLAVAAGVLFGAIPLFRIFKLDLSSVFRQEGRTITGGKRTSLLRNSLVILQVAVAFVLLIGASLLFSSFRQVLKIDPGFETDSILTGYISLPGSRYEDAAARRQFIDQLLAEVRALPGVTEAAVITGLPFTGPNSSSVIMPEGYQPQPGESVLAPSSRWTGPGYFQTMGIPLLEGRYFEESDTEGTEQALIIDEWLARRYWPDSSPIGQRMFQGVPGMEPDEDQMWRIIGVVGEVKQNELTDDETMGAYYFSYKQAPRGFFTLVTRTAVEPASMTEPIRQKITDLDVELPFFGVETMEDLIGDSLQARRSPMILLVVFAGVALFLAAVGIYGILAYSVNQRTRELGIMLALGSSGQRVFRNVVLQGFGMIGIGLALGAGGTLLLVQLIRSQLYGISPVYPAAYIAVCVMLFAVALVACSIPARRATRIDPMTALRWE